MASMEWDNGFRVNGEEIGGQDHRPKKRTGSAKTPHSAVLLWSLLFLLAVPAGSAHGGWLEYEIVQGAFAVSMPAPPVVENHAVDTDNGTIEARIVLSKTGSSAAFAVVFCEYPQDALFCRAPEQYLTTVGRRLLQRMKGALVREREIRIDGFPGREIEMTLPKGILHLKLFAVGRRSYQVYAVALDDTPSHAEADRFLASFRLLSRPGFTTRNP